MADYAILHRSTRVIAGLTTEKDHGRLAPGEVLMRVPLTSSPVLADGPWVLLDDGQTVRKATRQEILASDEDVREEDALSRGA